MLNFFRKHQKIFFLLTTFLVISSFIFFGTYQAIAPSIYRQSGQEKSYVEQMADFLNTEQWMANRSLFATNFLNDGFFSKEFFDTGIADLLIAASPGEFKEELYAKWELEKKFKPYTHPYQPSLSALSIWSVFAPDIPLKLKALQEGKGSFKERKELFLAQRNFPPAILAQIIHYQEQKNTQLPHDPRLAREDCTLFGYHSLSDWFGESFVESLASWVIKLAAIAKKERLKVTKEELLTELVSRSNEVYQVFKSQVPVKDGYALMQLYLQQIGMSEQSALKIWEDVTLCRKLLQTIGNAPLVDSLPFSEFYTFAYENALVEVTQMPQSLRLRSMKDLKRFEVYLAAVGTKRDSALEIPVEYAPINLIEERAPELIGKHYTVEYASITKKALQAKVSQKEMLNWECQPENWKKIQEHFQALGKKGGTPFDILENMEEKERKNVDNFARSKIVELHPEWVNEVLEKVELREKKFFVSKGDSSPFEGIADLSKVADLLDKQEESLGYTQDDNYYYRFLLKEKSPEKVILTYEEALRFGILDKIADRLEGETLVEAIIKATPSQHKERPYAYRFADYVQQFKDNPPSGSLASQFPVVKVQKTLTRSEAPFISLDEAFSLKVGVFSSVKIDLNEGAFLYRFLEKTKNKNFPIQKLIQTQELISKEVRCRFFESLLAQ